MSGIARMCNTRESSTPSNGTLTVNGGVGVQKRLNVGGELKTHSDAESISTHTGALQSAGGLGVAKSATVGGSLHVQSAEDSTGPASGAAIVDGGLGVAQDVHAGQDIDAVRNLHAGNRVLQDAHMLMPPGAVMPYAGDSAPGGYLLCDGSTVARSQYPLLFSVVGTTWGNGDGLTTFNLPDLRDRSVLGVSGTNSIGSIGGSATHTMTVDQMPQHSHTGTTDTAGAHVHSVADPGHTHALYISRDDNNGSNDNGQAPAGDAYLNADTKLGASSLPSTTGISVNSAGAHAHSFTTNTTGSGESFSLQSPFLALNFIIKY